MPEPGTASGKASSAQKEGADTGGAKGQPAGDGKVANTSVGSDSGAAEGAAGPPTSKVGPGESLHVLSVRWRVPSSHDGSICQLTMSIYTRSLSVI